MIKLLYMFSILLSVLVDKYRLLMRRDQVHKVACNHLIAGNMTLSPMSTSETAWCWTAQDYAENEAKVEQFALRFKTEELARQFKKKFEEVQELVRARESVYLSPEELSKRGTDVLLVSQAKNTNNSAIVSKSQDVPVTEEKEEEDDDSEEESIMFEKRATSTYFENDEWKAGRHIRPSPEHMDAKIRSLAYSQESLVKIVLARNEELVKSNSQLVGALRETREVITHLKSQLNLSQKYNYFSLSTPGPHMASPHHPPYPPPQGMAPPQFGYQMPSPAGLPGYRPPSPRTRCRTNLMGHTGFMGKDESNVVGNDDDENPYFIDGEFFKEVKQYYVPDSHLEWPYGNRAGIEGSSTVTYAPQNRHQKPQS
ncbi:ranBP2-like and GRIP domain-containing protein 4 [Haliotis rufescens]|uniref:ranBP2-like and GRIP domain-containing protein 4 n=1 Tax=Haliotis rufescens TaxID=6454 RepID=UPI00201E8489|nr:ranBP2-like and GRIP domain-containing protein 4 [Haliotis rufescens]